MVNDLSPIRAFLLDMDGTFYLGERLLPGALEFLEICALTGRKTLFLTNNSSKDAASYEQKLRRLGVREPFVNVYTSGQAAATYCAQHYPGQRPFLLGNDALMRELAQVGIDTTVQNADYVLAGYDTTLTFDKLVTCCHLLLKGVPFIATHPDINCPSEEGPVPDLGSFLALIEASTGRRPDIILGKPYQHILEGALSMVGLAKSQCAIVGDRLYTDIACGKNAGMLSILVLTGETQREDLAGSPIQPDLVVEGLAELGCRLEAVTSIPIPLPWRGGIVR